MQSILPKTNKLQNCHVLTLETWVSTWSEVLLKERLVTEGEKERIEKRYYYFLW